MCHNISTHIQLPTSGWKLHDFLGILGVGSRKESQTTFLHSKDILFLPAQNEELLNITVSKVFTEVSHTVIRFLRAARKNMMVWGPTPY
jgi:hypothetical protein